MTAEQPPLEPAPTEVVAAARAVASELARNVRGPLHALQGFADLLAATKLDGDQRSLAESLAGQADGLAYACDRLALLLELTAGAAAPPAQPFDLGELLARVTAAAAPVTPVSVRAHPHLPATLIGDVDALQHLLTELLGNAVRHGRRPIALAVDIAGAATGDLLPVRVTVTDAGPGMPEQYLSMLNTGSVMPTQRNSLIGLTLTGRLAARLAGTLSAIQRAGGATEIALHLSLRQVAVSATSPAGDPSSAQRLRILLVDDNSTNRTLTSRQLTRLGHQLDAVATGADGVRAAREGKYDIVLMDRHLPDIDGIEATRQIRAAEAAETHRGRVPIVAITADAQPGHREQCLAAGMDGFITKPVNMDRLGAAILAVAPPPATRPVPRPDGEPDGQVDLSVLSGLVQQFGGDPQPAAEVVNAYLDELPARMDRLHRALHSAAVHAAIAAAASLQSASLTIGASQVARICGDIGDAAQAGDLDRGRRSLPELDVAGQRALAALDAAGYHRPSATP